MELLAPVGSISALKAAIHAGANAVYLGLGEHNARIKSVDFNTENIKKWVEYAHLFGVKVHLTLNTALKDEELPRALSLAQIAVGSGVDALIVSDLGLLSLLRNKTTIPIHLSTQAGVQNHLDARFAAKMGVDRVILARETLFSDIPSIRKEISEVECFIQGALCVSFSGGCLLGSIDYGASGNRGVCNQGCRLFYTATDESGKVLKSGHLLSPQDLSLGEKVLDLEKLGVDSLKIEGRLKRPAYVEAAVSYYRDILSGNDATSSLDRLKTAFHRGFTTGYTLKKSDPIIGVKVPAHIGMNVGYIEKISERSGFKYAYLHPTRPLHKGDGAKILRDGREVGGSDITSVSESGGYTIIPVSSGVKVGDEVRLTTDAAQVASAERAQNTLPLSFRVTGAAGQTLKVIASCKGISFQAESKSILQESKQSGNSTLKEKLSKLGETDFVIEKYSDEIIGAVFLPPKEVNALRRTLTDGIRQALIAANTPSYTFNPSLPKAAGPLPRKQEILCETDGILYPEADAYVLNLPDFSAERVKSSLKELGGKAIYLRLPKIAREKDIDYIRKLLSEVPEAKIYADNLYAVELARELSRGYIAGFGLNIFNSQAASLFRDADFICSSIECETAGDTVFCGGKIPLMSFAHCPISVVCDRTCDRCPRTVSRLFYATGDKRYIIRRNLWRDCAFTMYQDKLVLHREIPKKSRFYSVIELSEEEKKTLFAYMEAERV